MKHLAHPAHAVWALVALTGCATYRPAPIEPLRVLEGLEAIEWNTPPPTADFADAETSAVGPRELSAFAVSTNPQLAAVRAEVGVRRALLVEAGLLPDPELSWGAMDVLASQIVDGTSSSVDAISGFGLMFPLLRPGERGARVGAAEWRAEEARRRVAAAEWSLTRSIHVAYEEVQAAEFLLSQTRALIELAESTNDYFKRARDAGAATAIQANLALGELQVIRLDAVRAEARVRQARQALNALLGLPPTTELALGGADDPSAHAALQTTTGDLTTHAVESRPDLASLLARYQAAEEGVRLAVSKQFPQIALGTGIGLTLPFFSKFGRPEIRTAIAEREQLGLEFTAAVHAARQEIAAAHVLWQFAEREFALVANELLPNAEQNLELSREAFQAGEITLLETLALQRALVEARTRHTETRAERSKRAWSLLAASGWLLGAAPTNSTNNEEDSQ
jgi:cobalt-zinc-cadmium efflux system outer membrane protein